MSVATALSEASNASVDRSQQAVAGHIRTLIEGSELMCPSAGAEMPAGYVPPES